MPKFRHRKSTMMAGVTTGGVALVAGVLTGCNDLGPLDAQMQELLSDRTTLIHAENPPGYRPALRMGEAPRAVYEKTPGTVNPPAEQLRFTVADEARDVAARLAAYQTVDESAAVRLSLADALRQAQATGREHLTAQEQYMLAALSLMAERHLWGPRFFADVDALFTSDQFDGDTESTLRLISQLRATQRLPYGGQVEARLVWEATENLRSSATERYRQSSSLILEGNIPLLRGAGLYAQESLIQAERDLVYAARNYEDFRRSYLVDIATNYFDLLQQLAEIRNTERQLAGFQRIETQEQALYEAGRIPQLRVNNAANQLRQAEDSLANQRDNFTLAVDRFKVRLGIPVATPVVIEPFELAVPEPDTTLEEAVALALEFRLDLQNVRDQTADARRGVKVAENELLPDLDIAGSVLFPTDSDAREGGLVYEPDDVQYGASARLSLPLDRKLEKLNVRRATILAQRAERELDRARDEVVLQVRAQVRGIELARNSLRLSTQRVELTRRRKEEQEIKRDEFTTQELLDTEIDLLDAENALAQAATNLRTAVLDYLLATGQLRVTRDGQLQMLPGMVVDPVPEPAPQPPPSPSPSP